LVTGVCSFGILEGIGALLVRPGDDVIEPLALVFGGIVFVIVANGCYTLGWITELLSSTTLLDPRNRSMNRE
jgi:energy-converting hydrogenase Eha subunit C